MPTIEDFENVSLGTFKEESCSPAVDTKFRGLVIVAPEKIPINEEMVFPICGTYKVEEAELNKYRSFENEVVMVAVDMNNFQSYSGNLLEDTFEPEFVDDFTPSDDVANMVVTGWFNVDLYRQISELPKHPGKYQVHATIGTLKSNVVEVELTKK